MTSRIIEAVKISEKTLFYEIRIEDVEFHILNKTVKTNKWLRFEEWQQIYEHLEKSFSTYSTTPPDFTIKSFTVGNYIRVEVELFPIENCFGDLFKLKLENCMPDILQIRIKQIALGSSLEEIQATERKQEQLAAAVAKRGKSVVRKLKKKRRSASLGEYNPVTVKKNQKTKYVPPYKASKLSPDANEADESYAPYSPKPVGAGEVGDADDYMPSTNPGSNAKTSTLPDVPMYKPSAIVKKELNSSSTDCSLPDKTNIKTEPELDSTLISNKFTRGRSVEANTQPRLAPNRGKRHVSPVSLRSKQAKLSKYLFADSDDTGSVDEAPASDDETYNTSTRTSARKGAQMKSGASKKLGSASKTPAQKTKTCIAVPERRSARKPAIKTHKDFDMCLDRRSGDSSKSGASSTLSVQTKNLRLKKSRSKSKRPTRSQESGSSSKQPEDVQRFPRGPLQTIEELQRDQEVYERQIEALDQFRKSMKELIKPPPDVDMVDLNGMKVEELIATFDEFRSKLDVQFEMYKNQRRFPNDYEPEKLQFLILTIIDRDRVLSMMDHLQYVYEPDCDGVPTYVDLFMNVMAPEWILRIFMKKVNLSREEAIDRIKQQRAIEACNQSMTGQ